MRHLKSIFACASVAAERHQFTALLAGDATQMGHDAERSSDTLRQDLVTKPAHFCFVFIRFESGA